jgi:hypothetical protein
MNRADAAESGGERVAGSARIPISVEAYSGYRADERPVAFRLGDRPVVVREIVDRWYGEDHAYFKLTGEDGARYIIRQDRRQDTWELILMEAPTPPPAQAGR